MKKKIVVNLGDVRYYIGLAGKAKEEFLADVYEDYDITEFLKCAKLMASGMTYFQIARELESNG